MVKVTPRKGLMTTCLTLLVLAWAILFSALVAHAEEAPVAHLICQTQEFSPNVDIEVRRQSDKMVLNVIVTGDDGGNAISASQTVLSGNEISDLLQKQTGIFKTMDPISGPQLLALQNGAGHLSLSAKGRSTVIDLQACH